MRKTMPFADVAPSYYEAAFKATDAALKKAGGSVAGAPVCLVFKWDMSTQQADLGAGFPCQVSGNEFAGLQRVDMPAGKSYQIDYYGNYDGTGAAHSAMEQYLQSKGLTPNYPCFEQFMTDPGQEPDTAKWLTRVVYFAK
jgi:AraC family transcriptional regulator